MMRLRQRIGQRGFTLIELLVAISILAMVAVLGWRGLDGIVRARVSLTGQMETTRGMQLAFAQLQSDCEHLPVDGNLLGMARPYLLFDKDRLTMVRISMVENEPTRLQVVAYRLRDGVLLRRESLSTRNLTELDVMWKAATSDADPAPAVALQAGITGIDVQFWAGGQWQILQAPVMGSPPPPGTLYGLQVVLQAKDLAAPMVKTFLLGGA
jgi:general secretion pathway protein J